MCASMIQYPIINYLTNNNNTVKLPVGSNCALSVKKEGRHLPRCFDTRE